MTSNTTPTEMAAAIELLEAGLQHPPTMFYTRPHAFAEATRTVLASLTPATDEGLVELLREIAYGLTDQQHEPWPNGTDADRLHYWRDKAISAADALTALANREQSK